jgi:hypothetical protein
LRHRVGELILVDPIPDVEDELTTGAEHPPRFRECPGFVGEEHGPELADDHVKICIGKRQVQGIGLPPLHWTSGPFGGGLIQHRLVQIRRDNRASWGQRPGKVASHDARSRGDLEHA